MKFKIYAVVLATTLMAGCNVKTADDYKKETDEIIKKSQQGIDELTSSLYRGGQPGKITAKGVIVKNDGDKMLLDNRIKIEQIGGKGNRGVSQTMVSEKNKAILSEVVEAKDFSALTSSDKYINLGCENLSAEETEGLTEEVNSVLTDSVLSASAKKIFICGSPTISQSFVSLSSEQLVLKNANLKVVGLIGSLAISSMKLVLEGKNAIETQGVDLAASVMVAPSLDFTLTESIDGEGNLVLRSIGGNCVQKDEKK